MITQFLDYYSKAKKMQELKFQNGSWKKEDVNDDLVWHIPIYDVVNRRYAAFSSLLEAIKQKNDDPKNNGKYFSYLNIDDTEFITLCYLFRLCGSGINYVPKVDVPWGTHGFGNFWVIEHLKRGNTNPEEWIKYMPEKGFCDVKGYLLPMIKGGLKKYIQEESLYLVEYLINYMTEKEYNNITDIVDEGNKYLNKYGFKRQNFVLTAFAMDMAEYYPEVVNTNSDVYVGSNAKKCLKMIMPRTKNNDALRYLCKISGNFSKPYDMEDVACDFIRYMNNFQSKDHINFNKGITYYNNVLK